MLKRAQRYAILSTLTISLAIVLDLEKKNAALSQYILETNHISDQFLGKQYLRNSLWQREAP